MTDYIKEKLLQYEREKRDLSNRIAELEDKLKRQQYFINRLKDTDEMLRVFDILKENIRELTLQNEAITVKYNQAMRRIGELEIKLEQQIIQAEKE